MKITKVSVKVAHPGKKSRLVGFAFIELDGELRIENVRILKDRNEQYFLAMPSLEQKMKCKNCQQRISQRAQFCSNCGTQKAVNVSGVVYKDMVHPLSDGLKEKMLDAVLKSYKQALTEGAGE